MPHSNSGKTPQENESENQLRCESKKCQHTGIVRRVRVLNYDKTDYTPSMYWTICETALMRIKNETIVRTEAIPRFIVVDEQGKLL